MDRERKRKNRQGNGRKNVKKQGEGKKTQEDYSPIKLSLSSG